MRARGHYARLSPTPGPAGSYVVDHPGEIHWDGAKPETGDCLLEIVGMGPSKTTQAEEK